MMLFLFNVQLRNKYDDDDDDDDINEIMWNTNLQQFVLFKPYHSIYPLAD